MIQKLDPLLMHEKLLMLGFAGISAAALGMALIAQYQFGLAPCNLCVIQRYPYAFVIAFGVLGFLLSNKAARATAIRLFFIGSMFLINAVIAFYHTGVELKWWKSFLEGCNVPELDPDNILASIEAAPVVRCDEIPWADPVLGLSMANYNVIFCGVLAFIAYRAMRLYWNKG